MTILIAAYIGFYFVVALVDESVKVLWGKSWPTVFADFLLHGATITGMLLYQYEIEAPFVRPIWKGVAVALVIGHFASTPAVDEAESTDGDR